MPTQLPVRVPPKPEPTNVPAWIAGTLGLALLVSLTIRAPCDLAADGGNIDPGIPPRLVRIVLAHAAPVPVTP